MATREEVQAAIDAVEFANPNADTVFVQAALDLCPGTQIPNSLLDDVRKLAPEAFTNGQINNSPPGSAPPPPLPAPNTPSPELPSTVPGPPQGKPLNTNFATPTNGLDSASEELKQHRKSRGHPGRDDILKYDAMYAAFEKVTASGPANWGGMIPTIKGNLEGALRNLKANNGITGKFADSLENNLTRSFEALHEMDLHSQALKKLFDEFFSDLVTTRDNFASNIDAYNQAKNGDQNDPTNQQTMDRLDNLVPQIMDLYRGPIDRIADSHPTLNAAAPAIGPGGPGPGPGGGGGSGGPGGSTPQGLTPGGLNTGTPVSPNGAQPGKGNQSGAAKGAGDALKGATDAAKQAGDGAKKALGQAGDAAKKALGDALKDVGKGAGKLPEGMLGLGSKAPHGTSKAGGGGAGRGGGARGGSGVKPPPAKLATPSKIGPSATPVSRAGLSGASGQGGGAGTPAAGHRGGAADKQHKVNKALRLTKNGEEILEEADAVAPVVGAQPAKTPPPKRT